MWGYVDADGQPTASYFVEWVEGGSGHAPEKAVYMTVGLGAWGDGTDASMRRAFHIEARAVPTKLLRRRKPGFGLIDTPVIDAPDSLGANLTRKQALASPDLPLLWEIVDFVIEADARAASAMTWLRA